MPAISGVKCFLGGLKPLRNKSDSLWEKIAEKFAGNYPKNCQTKKKTNPLCRTLGSSDRLSVDSPALILSKNSFPWLKLATDRLKSSKIG